MLSPVAILKDQKAKDRIIALARGLHLPAFETDELISGIEGFWRDKELRNRLIHDDWLPHLFRPGAVFTRGVTRAKTPEVVFGNRSVTDVWKLARRLQEYDGLFSHRSWALSRVD